jgi:hypothetical protein
MRTTILFHALRPEAFIAIRGVCPAASRAIIRDGGS